MLLNPAVVLIGALYAAFLVLRHLAQLHHHRKLAKELHCQPPASGNSGLLGIPAFLVGPEIAPGVPVLRCVGWSKGDASLVLKSGNFGGPDFFNDAIRLMP